MSDLTEFLWLIPTSRQTKVNFKLDWTSRQTKVIFKLDWTSRQTKVIFKLDWTIHKTEVNFTEDWQVFIKASFSKELLRSMFEFEDKFTSLYLGVNYKLEGLQGHNVE